MARCAALHFVCDRCQLTQGHDGPHFFNGDTWSDAPLSVPLDLHRFEPYPASWREALERLEGDSYLDDDDNANAELRRADLATIRALFDVPIELVKAAFVEGYHEGIRAAAAMPFSFPEQAWEGSETHRFLQERG